MEAVAAGLAAAAGAADFLFYPAMPGNSTARPAEKWALQARGRRRRARRPACPREAAAASCQLRRAAGLQAACKVRGWLQPLICVIHDAAGAAPEAVIQVAAGAAGWGGARRCMGGRAAGALRADHRRRARARARHRRAGPAQGAAVPRWSARHDAQSKSVRKLVTGCSPCLCPTRFSRSGARRPGGHAQPLC